MIKMYLINNVISTNKKTIYGRSGERVYIIANHHPALIVCNEKGNKFSTSINNLTLKK